MRIMTLVSVFIIYAFSNVYGEQTRVFTKVGFDNTFPNNQTLWNNLKKLEKSQPNMYNIVIEGLVKPDGSYFSTSPQLPRFLTAVVDAINREGDRSGTIFTSENIRSTFLASERGLILSDDVYEFLSNYGEILEQHGKDSTKSLSDFHTIAIRRVVAHKSLEYQAMFRNSVFPQPSEKPAKKSKKTAM